MSVYPILLHPPCRIVQEALITLGVAADPSVAPLGDFPVYSSKEPDLPDEVLTVYDTQGTNSGALAETGEMVEFPGIMIRMRMRRYGSGYAKMVTICDAVDALKRLTVTISDDQGSATYRINELRRKGQPVPMQGMPASNRKLITINCISSITRTA